MRKTLKEQLKQYEKQHKALIKNGRTKSQMRKSEVLSENEIKEPHGDEYANI
ncbi:hypothetical protein J6TS2_31630 [Heyndrickxia sporothermodurans]|nr:hypothetical protein J6TS2_31630 [Heyndrickxia sporothermodurans]